MTLLSLPNTPVTVDWDEEAQILTIGHLPDGYEVVEGIDTEDVTEREIFIMMGEQ